jgi:divalent metal cation (Fe/Co/Zn/Cd) transporter
MITVLKFLKFLATNKYALTALGVAAAFLAVNLFLSRLENRAADEARTEILIQDMDAGHAADKARSRVLDCIASGGVFDFAREECTR